MNSSSKKFTKTFASYLDLANHQPITTATDVEKICHNVTTFGFNAAFVNPCYVALAKELLHGAEKIGTVASFPLGQEALALKKASILESIRLGADEIDISLNVAFIKEAKWQKCLEEMSEIITSARMAKEQVIIKFIPETGYLTAHEVQKTAELMVTAGADFFKTCSGMGPRGAILEDVYLIRKAVGNQIKVKVAGNVSTYHQAQEFILAGADRIGTSKAVDIITGFLEKNNS